tara:strand:+ start:117 stop:500 length:384 start_codon:yes stop_codon:yes gene_type:complete
MSASDNTMKTQQKIYVVVYKKDQRKYIYNSVKTLYYDYLYYTLDCNFGYGAFRGIIANEQQDKLRLFSIETCDAREYLKDHLEQYKIYNNCNYKTKRAETMVYNKLFKIASRWQLDVLKPATEVKVV